MNHNQTSVSLGALVGSFASILWWMISETTDLNAPEAIVAASVTLATALLQFFIPHRPNKRTRKTDD